MKTCSKCKITKELTEFYKDDRHTDGLRSDCKECVNNRKKGWIKANKYRVREVNKKWRLNNPDLLKISRERNKDKISDRNKKRYNRNHDKIIKNVHEYRDKNRQEIQRKAREKYKNDKSYREYALNYQKNYRKENRDKILAWATAYREAKRDIINKKNSDYRKTPIGRFLGKKKHYRKRISRPATLPQKNLIGELTYGEWLSILKEYGYKCANCKTDKDITIDHVIPLIKGGFHIKSNVQPLCRKCNSKKGIKIIRFLPDGSVFIPDPNEVEAA